MMDRFFDNYVMTPDAGCRSTICGLAEARDPYGVATGGAARGRLSLALTALAWLLTAAPSASLTGAAAPALFYADRVHGIDGAFPQALSRQV